MWHSKEVCTLTDYMDLDLSMYPSFVSSFYRYIARNIWWREDGDKIIYQAEERFCCRGISCGNDVWFLSGRWSMRAWDELLLVSYKYRALEDYIDKYKGLAIIASRQDKLVVASAAYLSRRTSYRHNVIEWTRELFRKAKSPREVATRAARMRSYQPQQLSKHIFDIHKVFSRNYYSHWELRRALLEIPHLGPKTADVIIMFTGYSTEVAPIDTHFEKFLARKLKIKGMQKPSKNLCLRYGPNCLECKIADKCLAGRVISEFGAASGLLQTISYIEGSLNGKYESLQSTLERYYT